MPKTAATIPKSIGRVTLWAMVLFVAACDVEAPRTGAPEHVAGLSTPPLLTGPEIAAAARLAPAESTELAARAAALRARAAALRADVLDAEESARLSAAAERP